MAKSENHAFPVSCPKTGYLGIDLRYVFISKTKTIRYLFYSLVESLWSHLCYRSRNIYLIRVRVKRTRRTCCLSIWLHDRKACENCHVFQIKNKIFFWCKHIFHYNFTPASKKYSYVEKLLKTLTNFVHFSGTFRNSLEFRLWCQRLK